MIEEGAKVPNDSKGKTADINKPRRRGELEAL